MKNFIFASICMFIFTFTLYSQTINDVAFDNLDSEFITITKHIEANGAVAIGSFTVGFPAHGRVLVEFGNGDYSTNLKRKKDDEAELRDSSGDLFSFNSATQVITFFNNNGYDLVDYNVAAFGESSLMSTYMMARKEKTNQAN